MFLRQVFYRVVVKHLGWPDWVGVSAAIAVECLGLDSVNTALLLREHNATKRKNDPLAPFTLAAALAGVYLVVAIALAVIQDVVPELVIYSPAIFPLLSLTGVTVLGLRADHRRRMETIAQEKAVRRAARESKKMSKVVQEPVQSANLDTLNRSRRKRKAVILDEMVDLYRATPDIGASPGYG